jgi:Aldolase/RraA
MGDVGTSEYILREDFPVFARHTTPEDCVPRWELVDYNIAVTVGDVRIRPGDYIVADHDGIVAIPHEVIDSVLEDAKRYSPPRARSAAPSERACFRLKPTTASACSEAVGSVVSLGPLPAMVHQRCNLVAIELRDPPHDVVRDWVKVRRRRVRPCLLRVLRPRDHGGDRGLH